MFCAGGSALLARCLACRTVRMFIRVLRARICAHGANMSTKSAKVAMVF